MPGPWQIGTASMVLATAWTMGGRAGEPQLSPLALTVTIYDYAGLPAPVLERAKEVSASSYERIGVSFTWRMGRPVTAAAGPTSTADCPESPAPLVHLRLIGRTANAHRAIDELGFAGSGGTLASVLVERVEYVAKRNRLGVGELLGIIMAHEIAHLLLPPNSHSTGIMSPRIDLFLIDRGGPSFDQHQASIIRARIASMPRGQGSCEG